MRNLFIATMLIALTSLSASAETIYMGSGNGASVGGGLYIKNTSTQTEEQANNTSIKTEVITSDVGYSVNSANSQENARKKEFTNEEKAGSVLQQSLDFSQDFGVSYP
jgi:hypothetical protein